jgi:hypothetical protein
MRNREDILNDLINLKSNLTELQKELSQYSWDIETPVLIINKKDFTNVLQRCIDGKLTFLEVENWADAIECRDDLGFEDNNVQEIIFELANPDINGEITKDLLKAIIYKLT